MIYESWGEVDIPWANIFLLIIAIFIYWCYIIFTDRRPNRVKPNTIAPANPNNDTIFERLKHNDDYSSDEEYDTDSDSSYEEYYIVDSDLSDTEDYEGFEYIHE